jgi:hypothetical protein
MITFWMSNVIASSGAEIDADSDADFEAAPWPNSRSDPTVSSHVSKICVAATVSRFTSVTGGKWKTLRRKALPNGPEYMSF